MKRKTKMKLLATLSLAFVSTATAGVSLGVSYASAENTLAKPTGTNTTALTQAIADSALESFEVLGASVRKNAPAGIRFLTTISNADLAEIPEGAEFGTFIIPATMLEGELTEHTANVLPAIAQVNTFYEDVPADSVGYFITLAGDTLETAFPADMYGTVFAARSFVKYTYTPEGATEAETDYAYTSETVYRSISYVASAELVNLENKGTPDTDSTSFLNTIISATTTEMSLTLNETEVNVGDSLTATVSGATDDVNAYKYILSSDNEDVVKVEEDGSLTAVGVGTATITANIGVKAVTATVEVKEETVVAYSLAGCNGLSKLTVTFDASSLNADDIAMAELRNANNETVTAVYATAVDNVATFDMSGVANAEDYYAVITTNKTATPVITEVKANYAKTHDIATPYYQLHQYLSGAITTLPGKGDCNISQGWGNYVVDGIQYVFNNASKWQVMSDGKAYYMTSGSTTSITGTNLIFTDDALTDLTKIEIDVDVSSVGGNTLQLQGNSYHIYADKIKSSATLTVDLTNETDKSYFTKTLKFTQWYPTNNVDDDGYSLGYVQYKTMTLTYESTLNVAELVNSNQNPAKVSDGREVSAYDMSEYENIKALNVTFAETTETAATVELRNVSGQVVATKSATITENQATFDVSDVSNLSSLKAVVISKATVASVTVDYDKTYDLGNILYNTYQKIYGKTVSLPGTFSGVSTSGKYGTYTEDGISFLVQNAGRYVIYEHGELHNISSTTGTDAGSIKFTFGTDVVNVTIDGTISQTGGYPTLQVKDSAGNRLDGGNTFGAGKFNFSYGLSNNANWNRTVWPLWYNTKTLVDGVEAGSITFSNMTVTRQGTLTATTIYGN